MDVHEVHVWQERNRWSWRCLDCPAASEVRAFDRRWQADDAADAHDAEVRSVGASHE